MRHLMLIVVALLLSYGVWQFTPHRERTQARKLISHHGIRLSLLILLVASLMALTYFTRNINY